MAMLQDTKDEDTCAVAVFVSPHGFGHAARATSVLESLYEIDPSIQYEIFTKIPPWFFKNSLSKTFSYHPLETDIGFVQETPFREDFLKTKQRLNAFFPFERSKIERLSRLITRLKCKLVICDIAPMGIQVAKVAGVPSVLVENFTWDWIYQRYPGFNRQIQNHIGYLRSLFETADYHIQTEPICSNRNPDLTTYPVSRKCKTPRQKIRNMLGISTESKMVLISFGGIPEQITFFERLTTLENVRFVVAGGADSLKIEKNRILLPHRSDYFHPDLVNAADAVIGKAGYSTVAEVYNAGTPFGYIPRPNSPESPRLVEFIKQNMAGFEIEESIFRKGDWLPILRKILRIPHKKPITPNGADQIARFIHKLLITSQGV